jgi:hypothetical protein
MYCKSYCSGLYPGRTFGFDVELQWNRSSILEECKSDGSNEILRRNEADLKPGNSGFSALLLKKCKLSCGLVL